MKKDLILQYLAAHDLTTDCISGMNGHYGVLFALLLDGKINVARMDHDGEIKLTTADLQSGRDTTTRHTLMEAVNDGMIATLTELTNACLFDATLNAAAVIGDLGRMWNDRRAEHRVNVGLGIQIYEALNAFPVLTLRPAEAAD
ncbi:hypothetical protein IHN32_10880 [Deinococcus sp. 14RED07]|uniref:hypothetical protein n=1 Tax=Deinococcus sp. 14RED07 TaxID=2745874 RepID=UPI001E4D5F12|nr:hypothetical protein [Deinococcus sp. 14RED07]MCD0176447.1 hypothetical protein [Deinococcus sp. 14RED07]